MDDARQKHIILVRQLMALAESTRFEGERASALAKAKETMARYSLTEADITGEQEAVLHPNTINFNIVYSSGIETIIKDFSSNNSWWEEAEDE